MRRIDAVAAIALASAQPVLAADPAARCKQPPAVEESCHWIHGRLVAANGYPTFRIWVVGTHRILGVHHADADGAVDAEDPLPTAIASLYNDKLWDNYLFGDFRVCPLSPKRTGRMQDVCVVEGHRLKLSPR